MAGTSSLIGVGRSASLGAPVGCLQESRLSRITDPDAVLRALNFAGASKTKCDERSQEVVENKGDYFWLGVKAKRLLTIRVLFL